MRTSLLVLTMIVASIFGYSQQECELGLYALQVPDYPEVARNARLDGDVVLRLAVGADGNVNSTTLVSGPRILADSAVANSSHLRFVHGTNIQEITFVYRYRLEPARAYGREIPEVTVDSPNSITINSRPPLTIEDKVKVSPPKKK